jgi:prefoldin subunit 2
MESMAPLETDRKCFRLINGVLVERKVKDVVPALKQNMDNIYAVMQKLADTFKQKEKEAADYQQKHNIRIEQRK